MRNEGKTERMCERSGLNLINIFKMRDIDDNSPRFHPFGREFIIFGGDTKDNHLIFKEKKKKKKRKKKKKKIREMLTRKTTQK